MATIYTRAKAARKVIHLFDSRCGVPRSELRCEARLESDLGVTGDDTYDLLEAMQEAGVDLSEFDCHDRITPEGLPLLPMLVWLAIMAGLSWVLSSNFPSWPDEVVFTASFVSAWVMVFSVCGLLPGLRHEELRVRDLVLSVEAGRWISPKTNSRVVS